MARAEASTKTTDELKQRAQKTTNSSGVEIACVGTSAGISWHAEGEASGAPRGESQL